MPIRPEHRCFYPIDWPELSRVIRFERAGGRCEGCGKQHGARILHLGDGRWFDEEARLWRDHRGRRVAASSPIGQAAPRFSLVVLAAAHREHDTSLNSGRDLAAWCQWCHLANDRAEHQRRRQVTLFRRRALGDLFLGAYALPRPARSPVRPRKASSVPRRPSKPALAFLRPVSLQDQAPVPGSL